MLACGLIGLAAIDGSAGSLDTTASVFEQQGHRKQFLAHL